MPPAAASPAPEPDRLPDRPRAELRASHDDREAVVERLRQAAGDGRLDLDELEERLERAFAAKTYGDLEPLTADLPPERPAPEPGPPMVIKGGWHGTERVGRWTVPASLVVRAGVGGAKLDFTRAECPFPEVGIELRGDMGGITLIVPEGWAVDTTGVDPGIGGLKDKTAGSDRRPGAPLLRLTGSAGVGGTTVRHPNRWERRKLRGNPA
jgi:hypothetical protein